MRRIEYSTVNQHAMGHSDEHQRGQAHPKCYRASCLALPPQPKTNPATKQLEFSPKKMSHKNPTICCALRCHKDLTPRQTSVVYEDRDDPDHLLWVEEWVERGMLERRIETDVFKTLIGALRTLATLEDCRLNRIFLLVPAQQYVVGFLSSFKEFPPGQKVGSFSLDQVPETLQRPPTGSN